MLVTSIFSFSHNVYKILLFLGQYQSGLRGKKFKILDCLHSLEFQQTQKCKITSDGMKCSAYMLLFDNLTKHKLEIVISWPFLGIMTDKSRYQLLTTQVAFFKGKLSQIQKGAWHDYCIKNVGWLYHTV